MWDHWEPEKTSYGSVPPLTTLTSSGIKTTAYIPVLVGVDDGAFQLAPARERQAEVKSWRLLSDTGLTLTE